ncbi:16S rRNA (guanine(966)-N(2))-methyltransferase RsmD [Teredinibacter sp. KSP-S5-2]|uniref:16S rRNA (guanine(966)-N(2))-methyltransferase RsmD n=1 Tax=Teredinibacter sp. KSP-S5-2 TaxID=3034506 RepID=UPI0029350E25|nr:16S rRNA (guanine(966)-N(2))-methyltransferase RsmD [Teredinibacter sp. KSP-S5-2]WNO11750.1 16S rRNA (guanine(966)-N(2))-methyltransferase RsmD [Teredinibacter sp. KSP-S5-2]
MPKKRTNPKTSQVKSSSQIRIIGGTWRSRKLPVLEHEGLRPTGDRMRETLFNWIAPWLPGANCLDLFAGTGALGLEALSRGARHTQFIERSAKVAGQLASNLHTLDVESLTASLANTDALGWLSRPATEKFDIVFIDPPFAADLWQNAIDLLQQNNWLAEDSMIYLEAPKNHILELPHEWAPHREKINGDVRCILCHFGDRD